MYTEDAAGRLVPLLPRHDLTRRQDVPRVYALNGAVYVAKTDELIARRRFVTDETLAWKMPRSRSVDIDTELDLRIAGLLLAGA
jgi:N-acylneuraminate cytidylyltransferase